MAAYHTSPDFASLLIQAATLRGENSEPDHEVGDLQDLFLACWHMMSPEQRALALSDPQGHRIKMGVFHKIGKSRHSD